MSIVLKDAGLVFNGLLKLRSATTQIVVHHSDGNPNLTVQQIHAEHLSKGWAGIGYHYYITPDGTIWHGRPENMIGAHAFQDAAHEANSNGIGICLAGDFTSAQPTAPQMSSVVALINDIKTRYPGVAIRRHSDVMATQCPGLLFPWGILLNDLEGGGNNVNNKTPCKIDLKGKVFPGYLENGQAKFDAGVVVTEVIAALNNTWSWDPKSITVTAK